MDAGCELDALIAEKVMGWMRLVTADHTNDSTETARSFGIIYGWKNAAGVFIGHDVPHYSTDIAAAFLIIDHMRAAGWRVEIDNRGEGDELWNIRAVQYEEPTEAYPWQHVTDDCELWAATLPLAICLAALQAVGEES